MKIKWGIWGARIFGLVGCLFGRTVGIAAFGSAITGAIPLAVLFAIMGFLAGSHLDRR